MKDYLVEKANILIYASYSLTTTEQQLLIAGISKFDPREGEEGCRRPVELTVAEMQDIFYTSTDRQNAYRDIEAAGNRIFERELLFGDLETGKYSRQRWVKRVDFDNETKTVTLWFNETLAPFFFKLKSNYTSYRLKHAAQLTSFYAIRIYECVVSWYGQNRTFWEISIDELRMMLDITAKYKQFGQLREKVIEIAVKQINESTDFELDVSYRKRGRSYTHIQFRFNRKDDAIAEEAARKKATEKNRKMKEKRLEHETITCAAEEKKAEKEAAAQKLEERLALIREAIPFFAKGAKFIGVKTKREYTADEDNMIFFSDTGADYIPVGVKYLEDIHMLIATGVLNFMKEEI